MIRITKKNPVTIPGMVAAVMTQPFPSPALVRQVAVDVGTLTPATWKKIADPALFEDSFPSLAQVKERLAFLLDQQHLVAQFLRYFFTMKEKEERGYNLLEVNAFETVMPAYQLLRANNVALLIDATTFAQKNRAWFEEGKEPSLGSLLYGYLSDRRFFIWTRSQLEFSARCTFRDERLLKVHDHPVLVTRSWYKEWQLELGIDEENHLVRVRHPEKYFIIKT